MKLQNLTVIFIIIILPIILLVSLYISTGIKTIKYQAIYDDSLLNATHDAIYAFEQNSINNKYSDNAETKRSIIKSSVKMFQTSLAAGCNISIYDTKEIDNYIPALVFGMYDGFYMYAPTLNAMTDTYEKDLKSYVYYSEVLSDKTVIRYSLDNYVSVTTELDGKYLVKEGYLINLEDLEISGDNIKYKDVQIKSEEIIDGRTNTDAIKYYKEAKVFTEWFLNDVKLGDVASYLKIDSSNDPEDPNSEFSKNKRKIIRDKIETVLNSTITAYSKRTWGTNYKMPKLSEEDWEKIYNNISMISFFQGKQIGLTKYNGYCVLNSTNSSEFVSPNLMYFTDESGWYHEIRCSECNSATTLTGYRVGSFENKKLPAAIDSSGRQKKDEFGNLLYNDNGIETTYPYKYEHAELACYECINGQINNKKTIYEYINGESGVDYASESIRTAYWTSLARERYNMAKLTSVTEDESIDIRFEVYGGTVIAEREDDFAIYNRIYTYGETINIPPIDIATRTGYELIGWSSNGSEDGIISVGTLAKHDTTYYAVWKSISMYTVTFDTNGGTSVPSMTVSSGTTITEPATTKSGNNFAGWYKDSGYTQEFDFSSSITENITLYAKWEPIVYCTVTFDTKGGSSISNETVSKGEKVTQPGNPTKSEVVFAGWYTDSTYTTVFDFDTPITSNITLYAKWTPMIEDVQYSSGKIYAKISSDDSIAKVEIKRTILGVPHTRDMDPSTKVISGKQYNYEYDFTFNPSEGKECTIIVTDTNGNKDTYIYTIP